MSLSFRASVAPLDLSALNQLAQAIADPGFAIFPNFLAADISQDLVTLIEEKILSNELKRAGIGKGIASQVHSEIRTDSIFWLDPNDSNTTAQRWLGAMDLLCAHLRSSLFLPVHSYEGHLARYPGSGFYKAHLDQHQKSAARQISIIIYLNEDWNASDGGQLRLYTDVSRGVKGPFIDVIPRFGTLVIFRSADFWHEVLPASRSRLSLTGWLRGRDTPG
ncbi:MAG: 2OG-Fe(II) oxygenase [Verrucomicrobiaceae bacterium]|nr:2OG-Fe(II) oxygenase [Verrucomicrobiaceae bacterium]